MSEASEVHGDTCDCGDCQRNRKRARKAAYMREYNRRRKASDPEFAQRNREYWRLYRQQWRDQNPGAGREIQAQWREENQDHSNAYHRKWIRERRADPVWNEKRKAQRRAHRANATPEWRDRERSSDRARFRRYAESGKRQATMKAWCERNKERIHAYQVIKNANRRARERAAGGTWTWEQFKDLCFVTGNRCYYCGGVPEKLTPDHAIPLARGGTNDITNIVPACLTCNVSKHTMTLDEYVARLMEGNQP